MPWNSFKDLAEQKTKHQLVYQQAQQSLVITEANKLLTEFWPTAVNKIQAVYLKDKILTIAVLTDELIFNLTGQKEQFLQNLNTKFSDEVVADWQLLT